MQTDQYQWERASDRPPVRDANLPLANESRVYHH
jgi:hypothetical protein